MGYIMDIFSYVLLKSEVNHLSMYLVSTHIDFEPTKMTGDLLRISPAVSWDMSG